MVDTIIESCAPRKGRERAVVIENFSTETTCPNENGAKVAEIILSYTFISQGQNHKKRFFDSFQKTIHLFKFNY